MCTILVVTQLHLINLKNGFVYEIGLIAIREVPPPFDEERQYGRPYQPKPSPSVVGYLSGQRPHADSRTHLSFSLHYLFKTATVFYTL